MTIALQLGFDMSSGRISSGSAMLVLTRSVEGLVGGGACRELSVIINESLTLRML